MAEARIDVTVEHRNLPQPPAGDGKHPNTCPRCRSHYREDELDLNLRVCAQCGYHFPMRARARIESLVDSCSFFEHEADLVGQGAIDGHACELAVMDFAFLGGSMGSAVGEKVVRACESAIERHAPLVCVTSSGGARMQEGILSLMQLPKTVCAVEELHDASVPMFTVMAHPTTAGVLASCAA